VPLLAGLAVAVAANAFWLFDWVGYWWIRVPAPANVPLPRPTLRAFWQAPLWGAGIDKAVAMLLLAAGLAGLVLLYRRGQRLAARLLGLGLVGLTGLALAGVCSDALCRLGSCQLLLPALLFACVPAAVALARLNALLCAWGGSVACPGLVLVGAMALAWLAAPEAARQWAARLARPEPFQIGLGEQRSALVEAIRKGTTEEARILWEDLPADRDWPRWTALLPVLTGRAFVGGLDADAGIEHATSGLVDRRLAGRPVKDFRDEELADYCRRYNIGWVVCWSDEARQLFGRWAPAGKPSPLPAADGQAGYLFSLRRTPSYPRTPWSGRCAGGPPTPARSSWPTPGLSPSAARRRARSS
jgi:hypothetical protein